MYIKPITPNFTLSIEASQDPEIVIYISEDLSQYIKTFELHQFLILLNNPTIELNQFIEPYLETPEIRYIDSSFIRRFLHKTPSFLELANIWRIIITLIHYQQNFSTETDSPLRKSVTLIVNNNQFDEQITLTPNDFYYYAFAAISSIKEQIQVCLKQDIIIDMTVQCNKNNINLLNIPTLENIFRTLTNIEFDTDMQVVNSDFVPDILEQSYYYLIYFSDNKGIYTFLDKVLTQTDQLIGYSIIDVNNFCVNKIYRINSLKQQINSICSIQIQKGKSLNVPKQLFIWQQNTKQLMHLSSLVCSKIDQHIDRTTCVYGDIPEDDQGYKLIQSLADKKVEVFLDFDLQVPITGESCTQMYSEYYDSQFQQIMINNSTVSIKIPKIKLFENQLTQKPIKRIILDYNQFKTIQLAVDEIRRIFFKLRPKGLILAGMELITDNQLQVLDVLLQINFPSQLFFGFFRNDIQTFKIQKILKFCNLQDLNLKVSKTDICLYRQTLIDIVSLLSKNKLNQHIFSFDSMKLTINNIDLRNLQQFSIDRHAKQQKFPNLSLNSQVVSLDFELPSYLFNLRKYANNSIYNFKEQVLIFQFEYEAGIKVVILNLGNQVYYQHNFGNKFQALQNEIVEIQQELFFLEPWGDQIYAFRSNQQNLQNYTNVPLLYQEFQNFLPIDLFMHSIQIITVNHLYSCQNQSQILTKLLSLSCSQNLHLAKNRIINCSIYNENRAALFNPITLLLFFDPYSTISAKIPKFTRELFEQIYEIFILKFIFNSKSTLTFFGFDFSLLQDHQRRVISLLFPPVHFNQLYQQISGTSLEVNKFELSEILNGYFQPEILIIVHQISINTAILASILSNFASVLLISPIYETFGGLESFPTQFLGDLEYTSQNFENSGIHRSSKHNLEVLCLHNFEIFNHQNNSNPVQSRINVLSKFIKSLFPRSFQVPKIVISGSDVSSVVSQEFRTFLNVQKAVTRVIRQAVPFRDAKFINVGSGIKDLNKLELDWNRQDNSDFYDNILNRVIFMRGILLNNNIIFCDKELKLEIERRIEVNWCCHDKLVECEMDLVGIVRVSQNIVNYL